MAVSPRATPPSTEALGTRIRSILDGLDGSFAVGFRRLDDSGDSSDGLLINGLATFHAASTMKTPVMIEVYRQARDGHLSLDDPIRVTNAFRSIVDDSRYALDPADDGEDALYDCLGQRRSIRTLVRSMIAASSNLATNLLIEAVGAESTTATMRGYGADSILVRRGVEDVKAYRRGLNNRTSARDLLVIFEHLAQGTAVSQSASREMVDILKDQKHATVLPKSLPGEADIAHKPGWISGLRHDSGIVILPDGRSYVLALLAEDLADEDAATDALCRVSELIYDYVAGSD